MAEIAFAFGLAAGTQVALGTINATIQGLTGALVIADGIVLGDAGSGVGESGIDFSTARESRELAPVTGSFTNQHPTLLRRVVDRLTVSVQLKGAGLIASSGLASNPPVDADMNLQNNYPGLHALLRSAGWTGAAWGAGVGHSYTPADAAPITIKLWSGSSTNCVATVLQDCVARNLSIKFVPGDVAIATFDLSGTIVSVTGGVTLPTFAYAHIASISAPTLVSAAHSWGIGAALRDFTELTMTCEQEVEDIPSSNAATGVRSRQQSRKITVEATIVGDSGDDDYEETRLNASSASTDDLTFLLGAAAVALGEVKGVQVFLNNPVTERIQDDKVGSSKARAVTIRATATVAGGEAELRFI